MDFTYGRFFQATTFFCSFSWFCNRCHCLSRNKLYKDCFAYYLGVVTLRYFIREDKNNFANMIKIIRKLGQTLNLLDFRIIFYIFAKLILIRTIIFIKFLLQDKKWQRLQNQQNDILQQKNVVAGKNLPYKYTCIVNFGISCALTIPLHN